VTQTVPSAAALIQFLYWRDARAFASLSAAAIEHPKTGAVAIDVDTDCLSPDASVRQLRPVVDDMIRVRSAIRIIRLNAPPARGNTRNQRRGGDPNQYFRVIAHFILPNGVLLNCSRLHNISHLLSALPPKADID